MPRIPPHNVKDFVYNFITNYPELDDNLLTDLDSLKHLYHQEMEKEFSTGKVSDEDLATLQALSSLFGYLLFSNSNGRQYNFKETLTERVDAVYATVSQLADRLRSYRRSKSPNYFK